MIETGLFPTALKDHILLAYSNTYDGETTQYDDVIDVDHTEDAYEDILQFQGPDSIPQSGEGQGYERLDEDNVRSKRFEVGVFRAEMKITREAIDFIKYKQLTRIGEMMAMAASQTVERLVAAFFVNGFSSQLSPDGVSMFNPAHPLFNPTAGKPTTNTNYANYKLSVGNVRSVRTAGAHMLNEHGYVSPMHYTEAFCGPDLVDEFEAIKESAFRPGSDVNDKNTTGGKIKKVTCLDFLADYPASANMWWMRDPRKKYSKLFWNVKPEKTIVKEQGTDDWLFRVYFRLAPPDCYNYVDYFGCDGTGSA